MTREVQAVVISTLPSPISGQAWTQQANTAPNNYSMERSSCLCSSSGSNNSDKPACGDVRSARIKDCSSKAMHRNLWEIHVHGTHITCLRHQMQSNITLMIMRNDSLRPAKSYTWRLHDDIHEQSTHIECLTPCIDCSKLLAIIAANESLSDRYTDRFRIPKLLRCAVVDWFERAE